MRMGRGEEVEPLSLSLPHRTKLIYIVLVRKGTNINGMKIWEWEGGGGVEPLSLSLPHRTKLIHIVLVGKGTNKKSQK